jgi:phosphoribosylamine--glycine ligase
MKTLVIGKGGREHALARALKLSPSVTEVHAIPGSAGMAREALCHKIETNNHKAVVDFALQKNMDVVVIGPEVELANGLSDALRAAGVAVFGPSCEAAQLEASKIFSKKFMERAGVPTARAVVVTSVNETMSSAPTFTPPYVLKADGLAAGKGVFICKDLSELRQAAMDIFEQKKLGIAGDKALLEQSLQGWELSYLCITNGVEYQTLPLAQDHKRLSDGDVGPNTGGMGVVAPIQIDDALNALIVKLVIEPTLKTLSGMGLLYRGVLYVGVMVTKDGPQVLEYNVRFGDPEAQTLIPLFQGDFAQMVLEVAKGRVPQMSWKPLHSACVVLAAEGYPDQPQSGVKIIGSVFDETPSSYFLHAGTQQNSLGEWQTGGGRVLNAIGVGSNLDEALSNAYRQAEKVTWPKMQIRHDIGAKIHQRN